MERSVREVNDVASLSVFFSLNVYSCESVYLQLVFSDPEGDVRWIGALTVKYCIGPSFYLSLPTLFALIPTLLICCFGCHLKGLNSHEFT